MRNKRQQAATKRTALTPKSTYSAMLNWNCEPFKGALTLPRCVIWSLPSPLFFCFMAGSRSSSIDLRVEASTGILKKVWKFTKLYLKYYGKSKVSLISSWKYSPWKSIKSIDEQVASCRISVTILANIDLFEKDTDVEIKACTQLSHNQKFINFVHRLIRLNDDDIDAGL